MIRVVVGSGGKTSLIKKLVSKYREEGKKILVLTSTHMMLEEATLLTDDADEIICALEESGYVMAGVPVESSAASYGQVKERKFGPVSRETYEKISQYADEVLIEADGSKHLPIKFPNENEPVIYNNVEEIIVVCGLHALARPVCEVAHRLELVKECLEIDDNTIIEPYHIQKLVMEGYVKPLRKKYPNIRIKVEPNWNGSVNPQIDNNVFERNMDKKNKGFRKTKMKWNENEKEMLYHRVIAQMIKDEQDVSVIKKEWFMPQPQLIICGGGHVAYDLVKMASRLDFYIKVIDDRETFANKERYPEVDEVICDSFDHLYKYLDDHSYYVVVTRGHMADYDCVKSILGTDYHYLGMIGSKAKVAATFDKLRAEGVDEAHISTIHAPIGLNIKARTPAEIAISILAEIIQEKNQRYLSFVSRELLAVKGPGTLCIITEKQGSAPRGAGSMMFVEKCEDGKNPRLVDTIGGGAIEMAVIEDAKDIQEVTLKEYELNSSESAKLGMICGGKNKVLFVPLEACE